MIKACQTDLNAQHILYDANQQPNIDINWFDPEYWRQQQSISGYAQGRGSTLFFVHQGEDYVLRHYHRGGFIAKFASDGYCWTGLNRTRAWREWYLLAKLNELGLPAPVPIAARIKRSGLIYRADLITRKIADTISLADRLLSNELANEFWHKLGETVALFHNTGVDHADLNAHNVLIQNNKFFLIDFDRVDT